MKATFLLLLAALILPAVVARAAAQDAQDVHHVELNVDIDTFDRNASFIILEPDTKYADTEISIPIRIYRGKTLKRTVYIWIEDDDGERISKKAKLSLLTRFTHYNLTANITLNGCTHAKAHSLIAEGLDLKEKHDMTLDNPLCKGGDGTAPSEVIGEKDGKISYHIIDAKETITSGMPFTTRVEVRNPTVDDLELIAWSYVYRSSNCYSGKREQNRKIINLPSFSNVTFDLNNTAQASDGNYSLKIKLLRSDLKTPKEFTLPVRVTNSLSDDYNLSSSLPLLTEDQEPDNNTSTPERRTLSASNLSAGNRSGIVFESSSAKARKLTVYFLIGLLVLILIALILKRL